MSTLIITFSDLWPDIICIMTNHIHDMKNTLQASALLARNVELRLQGCRLLTTVQVHQLSWYIVMTIWNIWIILIYCHDFLEYLDYLDTLSWLSGMSWYIVLRPSLSWNHYLHLPLSGFLCCVFFIFFCDTNRYENKSMKVLKPAQIIWIQDHNHINIMVVFVILIILTCARAQLVAREGGKPVEEQVNHFSPDNQALLLNRWSLSRLRLWERVCIFLNTFFCRLTAFLSSEKPLPSSLTAWWRSTKQPLRLKSF